MSTNAVFLLSVNVAVGLSFAAAFAACKPHSTSNLPRWCALGFGSASVTALVELTASSGLPPQIVSFISYSALVTALSAICYGLLEHYGSSSDGSKQALATMFAFSLIWHPVVLSNVHRDSAIHALGYQLPFASLAFLAAFATWRGSENKFDLILSAVLGITGIQFLAKGGCALLLSTGANVAGYAHSFYASISQTAGAILSVSLGIALLGVILFGVLRRHSVASRHDYLSGLLNRYGFLQSVEEQRQSLFSKNVYIAVCDLDHFKRINDTFGHSAGDDVIRETAHLFTTSVTDGLSSRFGGEEFVILIPCSSDQEAFNRIDFIREDLSKRSVGPAQIRVTMSVGMVRWKSETNFDEMMSTADAALYQAKSSGRNRVEFYSRVGARAVTSSEETAPSATMRRFHL